jgi:hypothetical protein
MGLGLASRRLMLLPHWVHLYMGDVLWALMVFWGLGFIWNKKSTAFVATISLLFSISIEFSQLYHAPWIDAVRSTTIGGLILGFGFLFSDLVCYSIGIMLGVLLEKLFCRKLL